MRRRWLLFAIVFSIYAAVMAWLQTFAALLLLAAPFDDLLKKMFMPWEWELDEPMWWIFCGAPAAALCASQMFFVLPILRHRPLEHGRAKSLTFSMIAAGLLAAALTMGLVIGMLGLVQLICANSAGIKD